MSIYEVLQTDHNRIRDLLNQLVNSDPQDHEHCHELIAEIRDELLPHSRAEESVFYNSLRALDAAKDIVMDGYQEHMHAEGTLRMLQIRETIDVEWKATAKKLRDALEHHINEEETRIFSVARQVFTEEEAEMMGEAFEKLKPEVQTEGIVRTTVDLITNLMPPRFAAVFRTRGLDSKIQKSMTGH